MLFRDCEVQENCDKCFEDCYLTEEDQEEQEGIHPDLREDFSGEVLDVYNMSGDYYFQKG